MVSFSNTGLFNLDIKQSDIYRPVELGSTDLTTVNDKQLKNGNSITETSLFDDKNNFSRIADDHTYELKTPSPKVKSKNGSSLKKA